MRRSKRVYVAAALCALGAPAFLAGIVCMALLAPAPLAAAGAIAGLLAWATGVYLYPAQW